jgi:hypothetical protein
LIVAAQRRGQHARVRPEVVVVGARRPTIWEA